MASLNTLPNEILEKIIMNIPERPFKTELLLITKALCHIVMAEQVRKLDLNGPRLDSWITTITNSDVKKPYSEMQYRNLLDRVFELTICSCRCSDRAIAEFISCCINLRKFIFERNYPYDLGDQKWNTSIIFNVLPSDIVETFILISVDTYPLTEESKNENSRSLVDYVRRSKKLEKLCIQKSSYYEIAPEFIHSLAEGLKLNTTLTNLNLERNYINDDGAYTLAKALKSNITLINLNLRWNKISCKGASALIENTFINYLDLSHNRIESGYYGLAESLKKNINLIDINLEGNNFGEGFYALVEGLKQNTALINLNLSFNKNISIYALGECLKQNSVLTSLNLHRCMIWGTDYLAEGLSQNTALTDLNLSRNRFGDRGIITLVKGLKQNTTLINLNIADNMVNNASIRVLMESVKHNKALTIIY